MAHLRSEHDDILDSKKNANSYLNDGKSMKEFCNEQFD